MLNKNNSGFFIVSAFILLLGIIFIFLNYNIALKTMNKDMKDWAQQTRNIFEVSLDAKATSMQQLATFVANDPRVAALFNEGRRAVILEGGGPGKEKTSIIRKELFDLVNPSWENMRSMYDVRQLHFHLGPGSNSFLRVHRPDKFGDNMDDVRYTIVDANVKLKPTKGFETGRVYSGIRGVAPVFLKNSLTDGKKHVGALESGTSFTVLLNGLKGNLKSDFCVLLTKNHVEQNMWAEFTKNHFTSDLRVANYFIEATTNNDIKKILSTPGVSPLLISGGSVLVKGDTPLQVCTFPLRDYRSTIDKNLPQSGVVVVWRDASDKWEAFSKNFLYNIIYAVLAFLIVECVLFAVWKYSRKRLQFIIDQKTGILIKSEQNLTNLINGIKGIILQFDKTGTITFINQYGLDFFGYKADEIIGQKLFEKLLDRNGENKKLNSDLVDNIFSNPSEYAYNENENIWVNRN